MAAINRPAAHPAVLAPEVERPHLRLIIGGADLRSRHRRLHPSVYRRRRLAALVLLFVVVAAVSALLTTAATALPVGPAARAAGSVSARAPGGITYVVQPGDTIWSVARSLQPSGEVRGLVDRLVAANGGTSVQPGDVLVLP